MGRVARYKRIKAMDPFSKRKKPGEDPKYNQAPGKGFKDEFEFTDALAGVDSFAGSGWTDSSAAKIAQPTRGSGVLNSLGGGDGYVATLAEVEAELAKRNAGKARTAAALPTSLEDLKGKNLSKRSLKRARAKIAELQQQQEAAAERQQEAERAREAKGGGSDGAPARARPVDVPVSRAELARGQQLLKDDLRLAGSGVSSRVPNVGKFAHLDGYAAAKDATKLEGRRAGESFKDFKRRLRQDTLKLATKAASAASSTKQKKKDFLAEKKKVEKLKKAHDASHGLGATHPPRTDTDDGGGGGGDRGSALGRAASGGHASSSSSGRGGRRFEDLEADRIAKRGKHGGGGGRGGGAYEDEGELTFPARAPVVVGLHRVPEGLMAPPKLAVVPRGVDKAKAKAKAAAQQGGDGGGSGQKRRRDDDNSEGGGSSGGGGGGAKGSSAGEMEALREQVMKAYREQKARKQRDSGRAW